MRIWDGTSSEVACPMVCGLSFPMHSAQLTSPGGPMQILEHCWELRQRGFRPTKMEWHGRARPQPHAVVRSAMPAQQRRLHSFFHAWLWTFLNLEAGNLKLESWNPLPCITIPRAGGFIFSAPVRAAAILVVDPSSGTLDGGKAGTI